MFPKWSLIQRRKKSDSRRGNFLRHLAAESLEDRSLLSVSLGLPVVAVSHATAALVGPATAGHSSATATVATQLSMYLLKNAPNGVPVPVVLTAMNAQNHPVLNYSGTVTLTSSDPDVVLPEQVTFHHGVAFFQVTFTPRVHRA